MSWYTACTPKKSASRKSQSPVRKRRSLRPPRPDKKRSRKPAASENSAVNSSPGAVMLEWKALNTSSSHRRARGRYKSSILVKTVFVGDGEVCPCEAAVELRDSTRIFLAPLLVWDGLVVVAVHNAGRGAGDELHVRDGDAAVWVSRDLELGYDRVFVTSLVAVAGGLGVIIPPSVPFVMYDSGKEVNGIETYNEGLVKTTRVYYPSGVDMFEAFIKV